MKEIFERENIEPNIIMPDWLSGLFPQFTSEIPHDPVNFDEDNEENNLEPINNNKQLPVP